jgi:hypothetical protein
MPRGYDRPLYILPFDHRGSFQTEMFGRQSPLSDEQTAEIAGGRHNVSCIVLGRGEDDRKVREWLGIAAAVPGFVGFAIGRTVFWDPLVAWRSKRATRDQTVAEIGRRYRQFVDLFERKDASLSSVDSSSATPEYRASMEG